MRLRTGVIKCQVLQGLPVSSGHWVRREMERLILFVPRGSMTNFMKWVEGMSSTLIVRSERESRQGLDRKVVRCSVSGSHFCVSLVNPLLPVAVCLGFMCVVWWMKTYIPFKVYLCYGQT